MEDCRVGGLIFRHEPLALFQPGEVAGHLHPCASVAKWGRSVRRRCFVSDGLRIVLPAFGAYAGGLDVGEAAIAALFAGPFHAYMLGTGRVYAIARRVTA
jgi:metallophosphoesterase superfamily enzyme